MNKFLSVLIICVAVSCHQTEKKISTQEIVDQSIEISGGKLHESSTISFEFRGKTYISKMDGNQKVLKRLTHNDSIQLFDILTGEKFQRFENDSLIMLPDSISRKYSNSVNSVHYFSKLPYGLNDPAVRKEFLGEIEINGKAYYKIKVTFEKEGGGDDFDDTYLYWFNQETLKADYLAYDFHVDGGGMRFREAYNERYIGDIRFVDYYNSKPKNSNASLMQIDSLFIKDQLQLLSKIELKKITILEKGSYN